MELLNELFLQALRAFLENKPVDWETELTSEQWSALFDLAETHRVLPLVFDSVVRCPCAEKADRRLFMSVKNRIRQTVVLQTIRNDAFLKLLPVLTSAGLTPIVVKGIVCRDLYPMPDYRMSGDEDILIPAEQFDLCHETLLANGMKLVDPEWNLNAHETPYIQKEGSLCIDLHRCLFPTEWEEYGTFNRYFEEVHRRTIIQTIQGVPVRTMNHTDHLLFLLCHSFKHFVICGFGIRQICDICLYANAFGAQIDWLWILKQCEEIRADIFAAALFRIGEKYLTFQPEIACYPSQWREIEVDERALLEDLLDAGVYGKSSVSRMYSRRMTVLAFANRKQKKRDGSGVLKAVFPSAKELVGRYHYLKEKPYLLPIAWTDRILKYRREIAADRSGNSMSESIRIANQRIGLLREYGIIDRK